MEIRYKSITHERTEDAPFIGALISSIDCDLGCKGCFNQHLRDIPTKTNPAEEIVAEVKSNPFNEGIILAGMEWSLQPAELLELAGEAAKQDLQVMIYTGHTLLDFQKIIGKYAADKTGNREELNKYCLTDEDDGIYAFLGSMILDSAIDAPYYIKCGKYDETDLATEREHFGVRLASNNQTIYKFLTDVEDKNYGKTEKSGNGNSVWGNREARRKSGSKLPRTGTRR